MDEPLDKGFLEQLLPELARSVAQHVKNVTAPLKERIAELEARPVLEDAGIWRESAVYKPGHVVSFKGSAWTCQQPNSNARPGKNNCWRLMVKSDQHDR